MYASALGASATRAIGTTDGVMTAAEARRLIDQQPLAMSPEHLANPSPA
jgi:hypothetical protein